MGVDAVLHAWPVDTHGPASRQGPPPASTPTPAPPHKGGGEVAAAPKSARDGRRMRRMCPESRHRRPRPRARLRHRPRRRARRHPRGPRAPAPLPRGRHGRHHGLARRDRAAARRPARAVAGGARHRDARHELRAGERPDAASRRQGRRQRLGLRPRPRLPRRAQGPAEGGGAGHGEPGPAAGPRLDLQGVRRHGAGDGEAAGGGGRARLAGQAHQPGVARLRLLAVPRLDLHQPAAGAGRARGRPLRLVPAAASTSARRGPSPRPTGSIRAAASPT